VVENRSVLDEKVYLSALCRVVPYHIVEAVLRDPTERALAQRRVAGSVMVADIVGFTPLCERLAHQGRGGLSQLSTLLDGLFERIELDAIFPFKGYITQFAGDALIVVFHGDDHQLRAVAAALAVRRQVQQTVEEGGSELALRIGLAPGDIFLNVMGDLGQRVAICAGPAVHRAIQLQQQALPQEVAADAGLLEALDGNVALGEGGQPEDLRRWPHRSELALLEQHLDDRVKDKIALLEPFIAPPLARRIRGAPHGWRLRGEIRRAVVQYVDVDGFTENAEQLALAMELSRSILRGFRKYDGVVLKATTTGKGQRIMVLYGLARPTDNDAERALLAALEVKARVRAFCGAQPRVPLDVRVGTHMGEVYLGSIGSWYRHDVTAIGDTVNIAARLAEAAGTFETLVSDDVRSHTDHAFHFSDHGQLPVRGREGALGTHLLHTSVDGRSHYAHRRSARRFHAGRDNELERLDEIVRDALAGKGRVIGITGPAGTGKSHLLATVIDRWLEGGGIGMVGRCRFGTRTIPLAPVVSMLSTFVGLMASDSDEERLDRIRSRLSQYPVEEGLIELLALLQPVQRPDALPESVFDLADMYAQDRVLDAIVTFVEQRVGEVKPLYVIEDLHHADSLTVQLATRMTALSQRGSFLFIGTYRPDAHLDHLRAQLDEELELENLEPGQCTALVRHEMKAHAVDPRLDDFLWRRANGNPALLVEIVRFLAERMLLNVVGGTVVAAEPGLEMLEDLVPDSWQHVALARLEGLGEVERSVLRVASAIGIQFSEEMLRQACDLDDGDLMATAVHALTVQQLVTPLESDRAIYRFRDEVTRATAYSLIPEDERRALHRRIADALERHLVPAERDSVAVVIAHHRERAGQWEEAAGWYERATDRTARAGLERETLYCSTRWRGAIDRLPEDRRPPAAQVARMEVLRLVATMRQGKPTEILKLGRDLLQQHGDRLPASHRMLVELGLSAAEAARGEIAAADRRLEAICDNDQADSRIRSDAAYLLGMARHLRLDCPGGLVWYERGMALAGSDPVRRAQLELLRGRLLLFDGETDEAHEVYLETHERALREGRQHIVAMAARELGHHALHTEDFESCRLHLHSALALDRRLAIWLYHADDLRLLGQLHIARRALDQARKPLEQALVIAQEIGHEVVRSATLAHLGLVLALTEDPEAGQTMCLKAHNLAHRYGLTAVQAEASLQLLRLAVSRADVNGAREALGWCRKVRLLLKTPYLEHRADRLFAEAGRLLSS
jgi:class 3 adenylate cyclase/tetratricopeptide (TPR) repeat protein